jgi:uncharacterized protein (DUF1697 family)
VSRSGQERNIHLYHTVAKLDMPDWRRTAVGLDGHGADGHHRFVMQRYAAFLRAINVGGHVVKMDVLRKLFVEMGFTDVKTVIASGNVIFHSPARSARQLEGLIERHLRSALGYDVTTFVRSPAELEALVNYAPFARTELDSPGATLLVNFCQSAPSADACGKLLSLRTPTDDFHVAGREAFWLCKTRMSESIIFRKGSLEKVLGVPITSRNMNSVKKMLA